MKKCTFYRMMNRNDLVVKTHGFCETVTDKNGHEITLCFNKLYDNNMWIVTEQSTGCKICEGNTRMEAFENSKHYIDRIYDKILNLGKYIDIINRAYEKNSKNKN